MRALLTTCTRYVFGNNPKKGEGANPHNRQTGVARLAKQRAAKKEAIAIRAAAEAVAQEAAVRAAAQLATAEAAAQDAAAS